MDHGARLLLWGCCSIASASMSFTSETELVPRRSGPEAKFCDAIMIVCEPEARHQCAVPHDVGDKVDILHT
jgi:hypothetical protein